MALFEEACHSARKVAWLSIFARSFAINEHQQLAVLYPQGWPLVAVRHLCSVIRLHTEFTSRVAAHQATRFHGRSFDRDMEAGS